jgi:hypothetical protein
MTLLAKFYSRQRPRATAARIAALQETPQLAGNLQETKQLAVALTCSVVKPISSFK